MLKVLFLGFSVTADSNGYVESLQNLQMDGYSFIKVGIGGIQPHHLAFLSRSILEGCTADIVVLEISTAAFRSFLSKGLYIFSLLYIIRSILKFGALPVLLDIPRADVNVGSDWVFDVNQKVCIDLNLERVVIDGDREFSIKDLLRDGIHTNNDGADFIARRLMSFFKDLTLSNMSKDFFSLPPFQSLEDVLLDLRFPDYSESLTIKNFRRTGLELQFFERKSGELLTYLGGPNLSFVHGVTYIMGPDTATFKVRDGSYELIVDSIDEFCYYERLGIMFFGLKSGFHCQDVVVESRAERNTVRLSKGSLKDYHCNYIGPLLVSNIDQEKWDKLFVDLCGRYV